jgi:hypothetical protein
LRSAKHTLLLNRRRGFEALTACAQSGFCTDKNTTC